MHGFKGISLGASATMLCNLKFQKFLFEPERSQVFGIEAFLLLHAWVGVG